MTGWSSGTELPSGFADPRTLGGDFVRGGARTLAGNDRPGAAQPLSRDAALQRVRGDGIRRSLAAPLRVAVGADKLVSSLAPQLTGLVKGKTIKISGRPALQLRNGSGRESIYVSISSKPEILRISDQGTVNFSAYGGRVTLTPPPTSDVIKMPGASPRAHSLPQLLRGM